MSVEVRNWNIVLTQEHD